MAAASSPIKRKAYTIRGNGAVISAALKQGVLYHDVDKGQPCFGCKECPGFEMHFWRKDCTQCGCAKDMHGFVEMGDKSVGRIKQPSIYRRPSSASDEISRRRRQSRLHRANSLLVDDAAVEHETAMAERELDALTSTLDAHLELEPTSKQPTPPISPPKRVSFTFPEPAPAPSPPKPRVLLSDRPKPAPVQPPSAPRARAKPKPLPEPEPEPEPDHPRASAAILEKYAWVPDFLEDLEIEAYFLAFPVEKVPLRDTVGERYRMHQLLHQLPPHDVDKLRCQGLKPEHHAMFDAFVKFKIEDAGDCGWIHAIEDDHSRCYRCTGAIRQGQLCAQIQRLHDEQGPAVYHHDTCFVCERCEEPLADLLAFVHENMLLCGRHFADMHRPRCHACDESIFDPEYTHAQDRDWHVEHFCCRQCDAPLAAQNYVQLHDEPCCLDCFNRKFAETCHQCGQLIDVAAAKVTDGKAHGKVWHKRCFVCAECGDMLAGRVCVPRRGRLYCKDDYERVFKQVQRKSVRSKPGSGRQSRPQAKSSIWSMAQAPL
eukprot:m.74780 g.74780  ORF g.74780 m.74780 type:complete len:542 (-) comp14379_c0_seq1:82-1707(-)